MKHVGQMNQEEYEQILTEIFERIKDLTLISDFKEYKHKQLLEILNEDTVIEFSFTIKFVGNDIRQMLSRIRRKEPK